MKEISEYRKISDAQLLKEYEKSLKEYQDWISKEWELSDDELEEAEYMSFTRNEIHTIAEELRSRQLAYNKEGLQLTDKSWQNWILQHKDPDFKLEHPRDDQPKSHWWEWIDQLESLSAKDLSTL